jgi:RNase P/RNase MRP subunit p30
MNQILIREQTYEKARKQIQEAIKSNINSNIVFSSNDDELNRKVLENANALKINVLLINQSGRKDFQKQRNSGFNQVMAKEAKKNNISIGINLDEIIEASNNKKIKAEILARTSQNIMLCNKNKVKMTFITQNQNNQRNPHDLKSLGSVLGMPTWMLTE